jgi:hypothetical protein
MNGENTQSTFTVNTSSTISATPKRRGRPRKLDKVVSPRAGWGRGWHLKQTFIAPDGTKYSRGQRV